MTLFEKNKQRLEELEVKRKASNKKYKPYCSPSRLRTFLESPRLFCQNYIFNRKKETPSMEKGRLNHQFIYALIHKEVKDFVEMPDFGDGRKKETKLLKKEFLFRHDENKVLSAEDYGVFIALKALLKVSSTLRNALEKAIDNDFQGIEKLLTSEIPKTQCFADIVFPGGVIDLKTTGKTDWLNAGAGFNFFKHQEEALCLQAAIALNNFYEKYSRNGTFYWLVACNTLPHGFKIIQMDPVYVKDVGELVFKHYLPRYERFVAEAKQKLGFDFFKEDLKWDSEKEIDAWVKLHPLLLWTCKEDFDGWAKLHEKMIKEPIEVISASPWAMEAVERALGVDGGI